MDDRYEYRKYSAGADGPTYTVVDPSQLPPELRDAAVKVRRTRMQYAHPEQPRRKAVATHYWVRPNRSKYMPHQGAQEMARRVRQMGGEA